MDYTYIIANWKMHGSRGLAGILADAATEAVKQLPAHIRLILCPPAPLLGITADVLPGQVALGGQNCHAEREGAFTGEISAEMLKDVGAKYVILGHSERRQQAGETDALVKLKAAAALRAGLIPVICVGESAEARKSGQAEQVVQAQMLASLPDMPQGAARTQILLAYEPIWAIGSGQTPSQADIAQMHQTLHQAQISAFGKAFPVVYGGSVNENNAGDILSISHVSGVLVGGASLKPEAFAAIANAAPKLPPQA